MLKSKAFWIGALLAYGFAIFVPPTKIFTMGRKAG